MEAAQHQARAKALLAEARSIVDEAQRRGKSLTPTQEAEVDRLLDEAKGHANAYKTRRRVDNVGTRMAGASAKSGGGVGRKVADAIAKNQGSASWSTGPIELGEVQTKALLDSGAVGSESGGLIQPDVQPGILPILQEPLTLADLMGSGTTSSPLVRYMVETVATSGAAGVPESGEKPESAIEFDAEDEPVKKIATFLPVTDEMIEDVDGLVSYVNSRLALFVRQEEEAQLLDGQGGDDLEGLLGRIPGANLGINAGAVAEDSNAIDHIRAGLAKVRESYLEPDAIILHPADWEMIVSLKDNDGKYLAGNPFSSDFGERLYGKRVHTTNAMEQGTALVGAFRQGAKVHRRGGLTVEASNSHADYFRRNKTAIRAEERIALEVSRPQAFATCDLAIVS